MNSNTLEQAPAYRQGLYNQQPRERYKHSARRESLFLRQDVHIIDRSASPSVGLLAVKAPWIFSVIKLLLIVEDRLFFALTFC